MVSYSFTFSTIPKMCHSVTHTKAKFIRFNLLNHEAHIHVPVFMCISSFTSEHKWHSHFDFGQCQSRKIPFTACEGVIWIWNWLTVLMLYVVMCNMKYKWFYFGVAWVWRLWLH